MLYSFRNCYKLALRYERQNKKAHTHHKVNSNTGLWSQRLHDGRACGSMGCDTGQCTNGCGFDSRSTCARLLVASVLCVGLPQLPLRPSSVFTVLRNVSFSSALYTSVAFTVLRAAPAERTARSYRLRSLLYRLSLVREIKFIHSNCRIYDCKPVVTNVYSTQI